MKRRRLAWGWLLGVVGGLWAAAPAAPRYPHGAVTSGHRDASRAGLTVLEAGGDAVDAAVATLLALGVACPQSSGLGGGLFALVYRADEGRTYVVDAREVAPRGLTPASFRPGGQLDPALAQVGGLAVGVPGEVRGMGAMQERWGKLPWKQLVTPAAELARAGVAVNRYGVEVAAKMARRMASFPGALRLYQPEGRVPREGEVRGNPALAATLEELGEHGPDWFYQGGLGAEVVAAARAAGGVLDAEDLKAYQVRWRKPVVRGFRGLSIVSMPPPSSGGVVLLEMLGILDRLHLEKMGWMSSAALHAMAEAMKIAYSDRSRLMADPDFHAVPVRRLLDRGRLRRLARGIDPFRASAPEANVRPLAEDGGTSHVSVADAAGNVVAVTSTINYGYGSLVVVPGRGFVLNNQMDDFTMEPGVPNLFGLVQSERNAVQPGKRPLSSMSPTIVLRGGRPVLVVGGSGGSRIITGVLQVLLATLVFDRSLQEAVSAPRVHHQWLPDELRVEHGIPRDVLVALRQRGHTVVEMESVGGKVQALELDAHGVVAAADPRKQGAPAGY